MRAVLILTTLVVGVMQVALVSGALGAVDRVDGQTARALVAARKAQASLIDADRAAIHSFLSGDVVLVGPGQRYQDSIKAAAQAIEQVSETAASDPVEIQSIDVQLVTYFGLIEQADAARRAEAATGAAQAQGAGLGEAYLWYASKMLREPGGLVATIEQLGDELEATLTARAWWLGAGAVTTCLVAAVVLLGCLIVVQWWMARRFRRIINLPLAGATVCAVLLGGWAAVGLVHVERGYDHAEYADLRPVLGLWQVRSSATDADGQSGMSILQRAQCPVGVACESTVADLDRVVTAAIGRAVAADRVVPGRLNGPVASPLAGVLETARLVQGRVAGHDVPAAAVALEQGEKTFNQLDSALTERTQATQDALDGDLHSTREVPGLLVGAGGLAVLIAFLTFYGFRPRLEEYRT
jgi:hypothetical protein